MANRRTKFPLKTFIPATASSRHKNTENDGEDAVKGVEISEFYQSTCLNDAITQPKLSSSTKTRSFDNDKRVGSSYSSRQTIDKRVSNEKCSINQFLKSAETNDVHGLCLCLDGGMYVNACDGFGWTALMCAACAGAEEAVLYLLARGADRHLADPHGVKAWKLAHRNRHTNIVQILLGNSSPQTDINQNSHADMMKLDTEFCANCETSYDDDTHRTSTVHQFNERKCSRSLQWTNFKIPSSNVGFQLMLKDGWDREMGLGPDGAGAKYPPKTTLKRDREGLGSRFNKAKPKITHFEAGDAAAIQNRLSRGPSNDIRRDKRWRERQSAIQRYKTIEFRRQFH